MKIHDYPKHQHAAALCVSVLTAGGLAAIASVALWGRQARTVARRMVQTPLPECGQLAYTTLKDGNTIIDSVILACETPDCVVIHCHGNPLLVEQIVRLCQRCGAVLKHPDRYLYYKLRRSCRTQIELETQWMMAQAATLEAVELLSAQITDGLLAWATGWIESKPFNIKRLHSECEDMIHRSQTAEYLINGVRIALSGPPNSGKSTLLNRLAAEEASIVSDSAGTTRDWISTICRFGPLRAELIDTAGLDTTGAGQNDLDRAAQQVAVEMIKQCDLVLNVRDCTNFETSSHPPPTASASLTVFTKGDLMDKKNTFLPDIQEPWVLVSAATDDDLSALTTAVLKALNLESLCPKRPACFTQRQRRCLGKIAKTKTQKYAIKELRELVGKKAALGLE